MARKVELYFKSENDAESVRSRLRTQRVSNVSLEEFPETSASDSRMFIANDASYTSGANTPNTGSGAVTPVAYTGDDLDDGNIENKSDDDRPISYLLTFEVAEDNYSDVMISLKDMPYYYYDNK